MIQKISLFLFVFCLAIAFLGVASAHANPGLVSVDSIDAQPGEQVAIPVRLSSFSEPLNAYEVYITFDDSKLLFDSGSFVGSIASEEHPRYLTYIPDSSKVWFRVVQTYDSALNFISIDQPNGILATLYFQVKPGALSGMADVDSLNNIVCFTHPDYGELCYGDYINLAAPSSDYPIFPDFKPGGINVIIPTGIEDGDEPSVPDEFSLSQNYPNPFNPSTVIEFTLPQADNVKLSVYNILGQELEVIAAGRMTAGRHEVIFNGDKYPSGIYFYRLQSASGTETRKMILAK